MLINDVIEVLDNELPAKYKDRIRKFKELTSKDLLRASFVVLDDLCKEKDWNHSPRILGLREKYKVVF